MGVKSKEDDFWENYA